MAAGITVSRNVLINCFEGELYVVDWFGGNVDTAVCHDRLRGIWRVAGKQIQMGSQDICACYYIAAGDHPCKYTHNTGGSTCI